MSLETREADEQISMMLDLRKRQDGLLPTEDEARDIFNSLAGGSGNDSASDLMASVPSTSSSPDTTGFQVLS